jgi:hypothetical protein
MCITLTGDSLAQPDQYHHTFIIDTALSFENTIQTHGFSYRRFNYDWSRAYSSTSVYVYFDMDQACGSGGKSKFPVWLSISLKCSYYIKKNIAFTDALKEQIQLLL